MITHGAAVALQNRTLKLSDEFTIYVCDCGQIGYKNHKRGTKHCPRCKKRANVSPVKIPYACKLLFQELASMNISCKLLLEDGW